MIIILHFINTSLLALCVVYAVPTPQHPNRRCNTYLDILAGRGFCSCCLAMLSIFVVLLALVVGVAFHCSTSLKDRYCQNYYNPVQARVLQVANETHRQAGEAYQTVSASSLQYYRVASAAVKDWYEAGRVFAHSLYASAVEMMDSRGGEENRDSGGGGEKATKG